MSFRTLLGCDIPHNAVSIGTSWHTLVKGFRRAVLAVTGCVCARAPRSVGNASFARIIGFENVIISRSILYLLIISCPPIMFSKLIKQDCTILKEQLMPASF